MSQNELKELLQEKLKFEYGYAPSKKQITIKSVKGDVIEFLVNGYWYKLDEDGGIIR